MKKLTNSFLALCMLLPLLTFAQNNGQYDVRLLEHEVDYVNHKYYLDVEVKAHSSTTHFNLSDQNYRFSFSRNLDNPQIEEQFLVGIINSNSFYADHTLVGTLDTVVSYNIELAGGVGVPLTDTAYVKVGRLSFDILNTQRCMRLWLHDKAPPNFPPTFVGEKLDGLLYSAAEGDYFNINRCFLNIQVNLEGALDPITQRMSTHLNDMGLLPGQTPSSPSFQPTPAGQPFNKAPWNYHGSESIIEYQADVVDWIMVELRENPTRASMVYQSPALLHSDGTVELLGEQMLPVDHPVPLYLFLSHQSHLPLFVADMPINAADIPLGIDLRGQQVNEGISKLGLKETATGTYALYAGSIDKGTYAEISATDLVQWSLENGIFGAYKTTDLNLDGEVNAVDKILWQNNNGVFTDALEN